MPSDRRAASWTTCRAGPINGAQNPLQRAYHKANVSVVKCNFCNRLPRRLCDIDNGYCPECTRGAIGTRCNRCPQPRQEDFIGEFLETLVAEARYRQSPHPL